MFFRSLLSVFETRQLLARSAVLHNLSRGYMSLKVDSHPSSGPTSQWPAPPTTKRSCGRLTRGHKEAFTLGLCAV